MDDSLECLSLMEMLDLRDGAGEAEAQQHLSSCRRCQVVAAGLPHLDADSEISSPTDDLRLAPRPALDAQEPTSGDIWRATATGGRSWPVVVLRASPDVPNGWLVVPLVGDPEQATDVDLLVPVERLQYATFADVI